MDLWWEPIMKCDTREIIQTTVIIIKNVEWLHLILYSFFEFIFKFCIPEDFLSSPQSLQQLIHKKENSSHWDWVSVLRMLIAAAGSLTLQAETLLVKFYRDTSSLGIIQPSQTIDYTFCMTMTEWRVKYQKLVTKKYEIVWKQS